MGGLTITGIDTCIKRLKNADAQMTSKNSSARSAFLNRMSVIAVNEMNKRFMAATGSRKKKSLELSVEKSEKNGSEMTVTASGRDVLFLEFGTGLKRINGPVDHPEASVYGYGFRTFSATHAKHLLDPHYLKAHKGKWFDPYHREWVSGNPPAQAWFKARELIKKPETIQSVSESVFNVFGHTN